MEESERPKKLQKREHSDANDGSAENIHEPMMTGALDAVDETCRANQSEISHGKAESLEPGVDGISNGNNPENGQDAPNTLSKRQLKKLRRREQWEAQREERKVKRKEKHLARKLRKREEVQAAYKEHAAGVDTETFKNLSSQQRKRSVLVPVTFVIDCGFDELMIEKERISLSSQVTRCYSDNNKAPFRSHLVISSFNKQLKERFDTVLAKLHENWRGVRFMQEDFVYASELAKDWMQGPRGGRLQGQLAKNTEAKPEDGEVVYLTSDSPHTLTELKPYSTYIVGGLVDKNRHKGICYKTAMKHGLKTAKLPIGEHMKMDSRYILATNHVVEIMLKWLELGDWGEAFISVMPKRKGGVLKRTDTQPDAEETGNDSGKEGKETEANLKEDSTGAQASSSAESGLSSTT